MRRTWKRKAAVAATMAAVAVGGTLGVTTNAFADVRHPWGSPTDWNNCIRNGNNVQASNPSLVSKYQCWAVGGNRFQLQVWYRDSE